MIENSQILEHIGETKSDKLIREIQSEYFELRDKKFPPKENKLSCNTVISVTKDKEIKSIGMSCINDLLLDNFGKFIQGAFLRNSGTLNTIADTGVLETTRYIGNVANTARYNSIVNVSTGTRFQVGQGTTPATRGDFKTETPFTNGGLEDNQTSTGTGVYTVGINRVNVAGVISPTTGTGSISEFVMFGIWQKFPQAQQTRNYALSRDNISPVANFGIADAINIDYAIQI